jgi:heptosyltransferase-2
VASRILIVRLAAIGDVVMASTVARRVKQEQPRASVSWLCGETAAPLVEQFDGVDEVIAIDERRLLRGGPAARAGVLVLLWKRILRGRFTDALLLHPDARYRVLTLPLSVVGVRVARLSWRNIPGSTYPVPGRYFGDEYARLLDGVVHTGPAGGHYELAELKETFVRDARAPGARPRVALVPGGARNVLRDGALKRWPVEHYVRLARSLAGDGCEVVLAGDTGDEWVRVHFRDCPVTDLIGRTSLVDAVRLFAGSDLVVSHDTGPMHLARLARAPLLALFGPTQPSQFVTADDRTTVLWGGERLACRPCYDGREFASCHDNQCMSSIAVEVVLETARTILRRPEAAVAARPWPSWR